MSAVIPASPPFVDLAAVKARQQAAWAAGNYAVVGTTLQIVGENLCEAALSNDVLNLIDCRNRSRYGTLVLQSEYLEVEIELKR